MLFLNRIMAHHKTIERACVRSISDIFGDILPVASANKAAGGGDCVDGDV